MRQRWHLLNGRYRPFHQETFWLVIANTANTGVNLTWMTAEFSCFRFRLLVLWGLAHCHVLPGDSNRSITCVFTAKQVEMPAKRVSAVKKATIKRTIPDNEWQSRKKSEMIVCGVNFVKLTNKNPPYSPYYLNVDLKRWSPSCYCAALPLCHLPHES